MKFSDLSTMRFFKQKADIELCGAALDRNLLKLKMNDSESEAI